jgi:hypothetical protein
MWQKNVRIKEWKKGHLHSRGVVVWGTRDLTADALNLVGELGA